MSKDESSVGVVPPTYDSEKGVARTPAHINHETFREDDFRTRNGLNLKSFQRRELLSSSWHSASL